MQLEFAAITKRYGAQSALAEVTLAPPPFHSLAIIGPSGGGKTTLLRIIAGLETPQSGRLAIDGAAVDFNEKALLAHRRSIGTVFQAYNLFPHLSARANVLLPLTRVHGYPLAQAEEVVATLFARFGLAKHADQRPAELSGGQQQRVAIVRAIAIRPRFLVFDEPTSALDPEMTAEVLDFIAELRNEEQELVIVTHNMGFAREVSDYALFIADGRIVEHGPSPTLFATPQTPQLAGFLARVLRY